MIQRIQSVFLLLLALAMLSVLALPLWHKVDGLTHQELTLTAFGFEAQGLTAARRQRPGLADWGAGRRLGRRGGVRDFSVPQPRASNCCWAPSTCC